MNENIRCVRCCRVPRDILEYADAANYEDMSPEQYVREQEGTYNPKNGLFACTECYIALGQPTGGKHGRWVAGDPIIALSKPSRAITRFIDPLR